MKCPLCGCREHVELDLHADGFSQDARECGCCGGIWTFSGAEMKVIKGKVEHKQKVSTSFVCPTCKTLVNHEMPLDTFQYHIKLYTCQCCGTVCSVTHNQVEVVCDSQKGSFLESVTEKVESDDYGVM